MSNSPGEDALAASMENSLSAAGLGTSLLFPKPSRRKASQVSKIYKQALDLFLTRQLPESFSTIESLITVSHPSDQEDGVDNAPKSSPIANASKNSRIKVWSLYLTLLNSILELGPEDGKGAFGNQVWRDIAGKVRDGTIWDEVVEVGYNGVEGNVDADVVTNL